MEYLPVDEVIPNSWNPNHEDDATFNRLVDEIADVGLIDPIEVVPMEDGTYVILGGEHRWRAAKTLGHEEVPCVILCDKKWQDGDLQRFATVRMNVLHGKIDGDKFMRLYNEMAAKYGADSIQQLMGFVDAQGFQKLIGAVKKGLKKSLPPEMQAEVDARMKEAKTVQDLSNIIQDMFNKHGDTVSMSYMIFTYGKQQHLYIAMNSKMRKAMEKVMEYCRISGEDINDFMVPLTEGYMRVAAAKLEQAKDGKPDIEVGVPKW